MMVISCALLACLAAGCASGGAGSRSERTGAGLAFALPPGWHRIAVLGLPGARIEVVSFAARGAVQAICFPQRW